MAYTIHVEGLEELKQKLSANVTEASVKEFLAKSAMEVEKNAKLNSPVDTGRLRASINNKVEIGTGRARAIIGTNVTYAPYQEFGTAPHFPPLAAMQPWARRHGFPPGNAGAYLVARAIAQHGTKGKFYMKKGFEQSLNTINTLMRALGESIKMKLEK